MFCLQVLLLLYMFQLQPLYFSNDDYFTRFSSFITVWKNFPGKCTCEQANDQSFLQ